MPCDCLYCQEIVQKQQEMGPRITSADFIEVEEACPEDGHACLLRVIRNK